MTGEKREIPFGSVSNRAGWCIVPSCSASSNVSHCCKSRWNSGNLEDQSIISTEFTWNRPSLVLCSVGWRIFGSLPKRKTMIPPQYLACKLCHLNKNMSNRCSWVNPTVVMRLSVVLSADLHRAAWLITGLMENVWKGNHKCQAVSVRSDVLPN